MERERELVTTLEQHDAELEQGLGGALAEAWAAFLASLAVAGTLEHPSWRYRVSTRYDAAQAATADLRERLERDAKAAGGLRDSAAAIAHASHLRRSARRATAQWVNALATDLDSVAPEIDRALTSCSRLTEAAIAEGEDVGAQLATTLERTASTLELVARRLERPDLLRQRRSNLTRPLAAVPEQLSPSLHRAAFAKSERDERRFPIRLRAWLGQTLVRDVTVALLDSEAETARRLTANAVSLHHARQVLDYHLLTPHGAGESVDAGIGERLSALIEAASRDLGDVVRVAEEALIARTEQAVAASIPPVLEGRWEELQRRLRRLDEGAVSKAAVAQWVRAGGRRAVSRVRHGLRHLADEVTAVFIESSTPAAVALYHKLLFGPRSSMNEAYQRLFTSVPAESVGLVIDRPEAATLEDGIERWLEGVGGPVLVRGDRGVGKRTLVRSVVGHLGDRIEPRWLSLSPSLDREDDVAPALSELLGWRPASSFVTLERTYKALRRLGRAPSKMAIVVENTERLFRRTPEGLRCMGEFLDFVETTHREVLWIVLVTEPAVRRIDPVLELKGRFAVQLQVRPMTSAELERVLTSRHRLSGYALRFHHHAPSLHEWIRSPGAAWRTKRGTGQAMYERIRLLSAGNVRQALRLWLAAAHLDEGEEGKVVVGPIDAIPATLTDDLPLLSKIILAALLLHGSLRRTELTDIGLRSGRDLDAEITRLVHLGLVEVEVEPASSMAKPRRDPLVEVRTRLVAPLTEELRACNLL
jgi:hypothetical protein